jgi:hypothetical protein
MNAAFKRRSILVFRRCSDMKQLTIGAASIAVVTLGAACASTHNRALSRADTLPPNAPLVVTAAIDSSADVPVFLQQATGDTAARLVSHMRLTQYTSNGGMVLTKDWAPPYQSSDTLTVDASTLHPRHEVLTFNGVRREFRYDGAHVSGTVQYPDSEPRSVAMSFEEPVFAFNELEPLVRSLDYRQGLRMVVPLFSEVGGDLEHDTLSVAGHASEKGADAWVVWFAGSAITTRYVVDAKTRAILDAVTTQRKSGARFHYAYTTGGAGRVG